jgi:hypothetical protein
VVVVAARQSFGAMLGIYQAKVKSDNTGRWIGRGGSFAWSDRSSDLTVMVLSCGENLKEHVYAISPSTIEDLVAKPQAALTTVDD